MCQRTLYIAVVVTLCGTAFGNFNFLTHFHEQFTTLSRDVEFELQQKRASNHHLIDEFNREMTLEFGALIPRMRQVSHEMELYIRNFEGVYEECREYTHTLFETYRIYQEYDIQSCALYAHTQIEADAFNRFAPSERTYGWQNVRSISQTMLTLSSHNLLELEDIEDELQEQLDHHEGMRANVTEVLNVELIRHGDSAYLTMSEFRNCRDLCYYWQEEDIQFLQDYLADNCFM